MANPGFLFVEIAGEHADQVALVAGIAATARRAGGEVLAAAAPGRVAGLEPGTVASGIVVARFADPAALPGIARGSIVPALRAALPAGTVPLVLAVEGLPSQGLPEMTDIPTIASVPRPPSTPRHAFLVVRGTAWDQERLNAYRDVILPMHKERGGYYEVFALQPGQVEALSGEWTEQIFAISRWPRRAAAEDFWYCDRYQKHAIPLRLGAGRFTVHMLEAADA